MASSLDFDESDDESEYLPGTDEYDSDSDTDLSICDEEIEARHMGEWEIIIDPFADKRQTPLIIKDREYSVHPAVDFDKNTPALKCFESFIPPKLVNSLCKWTNERAGMYFIETYNSERKVHGLLWKDVTVSEMYIFISFILMMGIIHYPTIVSYFCRSFLCGGPEVFSSKIMSRNRFFSILKFIRFSDPKHGDKNKPLSRLFMFFAEIRDITTTLIDIGDICALDECLLLYKGRLHFKQYIKTKRGRFGLKLFCLCPSNPQLRGHTYNFALYIGKDIYNIEHIPGTEHLTMSERVVVYLLQNMLDEGREVILDNWYLSLRLAEFLLSRNTYTTGTIRIHRGVPKELVETKLSEHQACFVRKKRCFISEIQRQT